MSRFSKKSENKSVRTEPSRIKEARIFKSFRLDRVLLKSAQWRAILADELIEEAQFLRYDPEHQSLQLSRAYNEYIKAFLKKKILSLNGVDVVIEKLHTYTLSMKSLADLLYFNRLSEEAMNAILKIYQARFRKKGVFVFNSLAYDTLKHHVAEKKRFEQPQDTAELMKQSVRLFFPINLQTGRCA